MAVVVAVSRPVQHVMRNERYVPDARMAVRLVLPDQVLPAPFALPRLFHIGYDWARAFCDTGSGGGAVETGRANPKAPGPGFNADGGGGAADSVLVQCLPANSATAPNFVDLEIGGRSARSDGLARRGAYGVPLLEIPCVDQVVATSGSVHRPGLR